MERAFRRDTAAAFALCGAGVGVLIDLRVMGVALFAAVPGLRALDLLQARGGAGRRRALVTGAAFVLAAAGTRYAVAPWLWSDPFAIVDARSGRWPGIRWTWARSFRASWCAGRRFRPTMKCCTGGEYRKGLEVLLARHPDETLTVNAAAIQSRPILPAAARERIVSAGPTGQGADFFIIRGRRTRGLLPLPPPPSLGVLHTRRVYGSTVLAVKEIDLSRVDEAAAAPARAAAADEPLSRSAAFDLHLDGRTLTWVVASCRREDTWRMFLLEVVPVDPNDFPLRRRERGWLGLGFPFGWFGVRFDGRCLARRTLPYFPVRALRVGRQWRDEAGERRREATTVDLSAARRR